MSERGCKRRRTFRLTTSPALKNQPQRYIVRREAAKRLDHVDVLAEEVAANRNFAEDGLGYLLHEALPLVWGR